MNICTYNCRTLNNGALEQIILEMENVHWDIIGLCETRQIEEGRHDVQDHVL